MFGKNKVKGHNRIIKGKKGFKVTRIGNFLRKKDDNSKRNLTIGVGAIGILGVGTALLLKKKGVKFPGQVNKKNPLAKVSKNDNVVVPKNNTASPGEKFIKEMDEDFGIISNATKPKINNSEEILVNPKRDQLLLSPAKKPNPRGNLTKKEKLVQSNKSEVTSSVVNMRNTQKNYDSLPLDMKVTVQMEKLLRRPTRTSSLGRPPESIGLKTILDDSDKTPLEKVISKAKRKVGDRLKRESEIASKKSTELKKTRR